MFLSRNYRLIVAPWKFDVLKTNICPRSEASRANMLVLRTSNFQGAIIRPIVPRHKHSTVFIVHHQIFFRTPVQKSIHSRPQSLRSFWPAAGIESSGSNHFEIRKEITEFCPSGLTQSSSVAHARNGCSQSSRFLPAGQKDRRLWGRE